MICTKCGKETGNSQSLCKLCAAGAPRSMTSKPSLYNNTASQIAAAPSPSSHTPAAPQSQTVKPQQVSRPISGSGEANIYALFGFVFAFFQPLIGIVFSIIGMCKSKDYGSGKGIAIAGLISSIIILIIAAVSVYFIILKLTNWI